MRAIAGAALAAVMVCGWMSGAEASPLLGNFIEFEGGVIPTPPGVFAEGVIASDEPGKAFVASGTNLGGLTLYIPASALTFNIEPGQYNGVSGSYININGTYYAHYNVPDVFRNVFGASFQFYGTYFSKSIVGAQSIGTHTDLIATDYDYFDFEELIVGDSAYPTFGTLNLTSLTIGYVPIPPSAPLFGAALFALGGAGYVRRRVKGVEAA